MLNVAVSIDSTRYLGLERSLLRRKRDFISSHKCFFSHYASTVKSLGRSGIDAFMARLVILTCRHHCPSPHTYTERKREIKVELDLDDAASQNHGNVGQF